MIDTAHGNGNTRPPVRRMDNGPFRGQDNEEALARSRLGRACALLTSLTLLLAMTGCAAAPHAATEPRSGATKASVSDASEGPLPSVRLDHSLETAGGAVACVDRLAATIGAHLLASGGNAVDAAVGTALALAVTWPPAGNLGGGGVMIIAMADGTRVTVDARETAPAAFTRDAFLDESGRYVPARAKDPWLCIGVPGSVAGLGLAHERFGVLPWHDLVEPAISLAEHGFLRDETFHRFLADAAPALAGLPASRETFLNADGSVPVIGTRLVQPALAETLRQLAELGPSAFYSGPMAAALVADVERGGGLITTADLASYRAVFREPLSIHIAGYELLVMPPPSSGGVAIGQILGQLQRLGVLADSPDSADFLHAYAEAARRAFAERARWLGDPDFVDVPTEWLLRASTLDALTASIDPEHATPSTALGPPVSRWKPAAESEQTTHISVIDKDGNGVSFTTTLEAIYGSKVLSGSTGVLLNNQLGDFNRIPGRTTVTGHIGTPANLAAPGKRPLTSMSPLIVLRDDEVVLVTGSPGGRTIINTVCWIFLAVLGRGLPLAEAVELPRMHHQWLPDQLVFEPGWPNVDVRDELVRRGHRLADRPDGPPLNGSLGAAHSVLRDPATGTITAVGDSRRDGWAAADR